MKQLGHTARILPLLHPTDGTIVSPEEMHSLRRVLDEQFRHAEGIRGFFAVYLTSSQESPSSSNEEQRRQEEEEVPPVLREAVRNADPALLVPLACAYQKVFWI